MANSGSEEYEIDINPKKVFQAVVSRESDVKAKNGN